MGFDIDREEFVEEDYRRFDARLRECLDALRQVLQRPGFGVGPPSLGAEVELDLVDAEGAPYPVNREVLADTVDPRVALEVDRFNLEINTCPVDMRGRPFTALAAEIDDALSEVRRAAALHGARVITIGTLPTLTEAGLTPEALTDRPRFRALSAGIRRIRRAPFALHIEGTDALHVSTDDVAFEGANTSFQIHLRVDPADFARSYNAAQIATGPVLAASGNSPLFLGRRLWEETRVALFRQSVDDRLSPLEDDWRVARVSFGHGWLREGVHELMAETVALHEPLIPILDAEDPLASVRAGGTPRLTELRLHNGTVWRWNRAVYDVASGGHLRIELRALPAGPTVPDMIANAAFFVGLTLALKEEMPDLLLGLTFGRARRNFYQAARFGLDAQLLWQLAPDRRVEPIHARALVKNVLPLAASGLVNAGVEPEEAHRWLTIVAERVASGRTGARWQREVFEQNLDRWGPERASAAVVTAYLEAAQSGRPVHCWI
jgi:gamma-glutamyl:cysteine ligase YbdK (ATP-grasp superfamily)